MDPRSVLVCACAVLAITSATQVQRCPGSKAPSEGLSNNVQLTPCKKAPCTLKKGTDQHVSIKFTPEKDLTELKNHVVADVFGVPLPFVGVDGLSVCDKIETEAGEKVSCPLQKGTTYVYKDSFPVLAFYPSISVKVHWALQNDNKDVACFEVPANIK